MIHNQSKHVDEIIVVDSASDDDTVMICEADSTVKLIQIDRADFDHGRTRDMAIRKAEGDFIVFLTQDAIPADNYFIENIIEPLYTKDVVLSTGRQLPKENATKMERLVREFNYPANGCIRSFDDIPRMGIKTFFCSDVCAAYSKEKYIELGGFEYPLKTNEDMFFAAKVINAGYKISYTSNAQVYHSHNFSLKEQYKRNYIQGYEIERHKELLNNVSKESEGLRLVLFVSSNLLKHGHFGSFIAFGLDCCARWAGSKKGKRKAEAELK